MFAVIAFALGIFSAAEGANTRIYGGSIANVGEFPSMAYLSYRGGFKCGCVIIRDSSKHQYVKAITSESCVASFVMNDLSSWKVIAGSIERDGKSGKRYKMEGPPAVYGARDIAILTLELEAELTSPTVEAAYIAKTATHTGETCTIAGWGYTTSAESGYASTLRYGRVPFLESEDCRPNTYVPHEVCVGNDWTSIDVCTGDQGGPLYDGDGKSNVLLGIAITIPEDCGGRYPAIYADLSDEDTYGFIQYQLSLD